MLIKLSKYWKGKYQVPIHKFVICHTYKIFTPLKCDSSNSTRPNHLGGQSKTKNKTTAASKMQLNTFWVSVAHNFHVAIVNSRFLQ